jgi:hypothetical protein
MRRIFRVIQIENEVAWREGKACDKLVNQRFAETINILAAGRMLKARHRRRRCQRGIPIERQTTSAKLEHRVMAQAIGLIAIFVAATDLVDALGQQIGVRVRDVAGVARVDQGVRQSLGEANLTIHATQQQRPQVGRQTAAVKICANGTAGNGWKTELF